MQHKKCCHGYLYFSNSIHAEMMKVLALEEIGRCGGKRCLNKNRTTGKHKQKRRKHDARSTSELCCY